MDTSFVDSLIARAETLLPPATVMLIECMADGGDRRMAALLDEVQRRGLNGEALCAEPYEPVVFPDRVYLRCAGCGRGKHLPRVAGIGRGADSFEARRNALYALTRPLDHPNAHRHGCAAAQRWGDGPCEVVLYACILNRAAYAPYPERDCDVAQNSPAANGNNR